MDLAKIAVGDTASFSKAVTEQDINQFAQISGDNNPAHMDEEYAAASPFGERVAHGLLTAGFIGTVLGMQLPGPGSIYLSQTLNFLAPVKIGDTVTATAEVMEIGPKRKTATLRTICRNQNGISVVEGVATVRLPRVQRRKSKLSAG